MPTLRLIMWLEPVSTLEFFVKGLIIGIIVSAPMGPVGILCIQRTLNKGRWYGFITGVGAAFSDIVYAVITGLGMSFVVDLIENKTTMFYMQLIGSIMLFLFGVYMFRSNPVRSIRPASKNKGTVVHNFVTAFLVTLSNFTIMLLFMALFARLSFVIPDEPAVQFLGYLSIFGGALLWWFVLTYFVDKLRARFELRKIWLLNRIIGSTVMVVSAISFIYLLFLLFQQ